MALDQIVYYVASIACLFWERCDIFVFIFCFCVSFLFFECWRKPWWIKSFKQNEPKTRFYLTNLNNSILRLIPNDKVTPKSWLVSICVTIFSSLLGFVQKRKKRIVRNITILLLISSYGEWGASHHSLRRNGKPPVKCLE